MVLVLALVEGAAVQRRWNVDACFAFTFASLDLLNWVCSAGAAEAKALVDSPEQVHLVLVAS